MTASQLSTPRWTCLVVTDAHGVIVRTAPVLWRWRGKTLGALLEDAERRWPGGAYGA